MCDAAQKVDLTARRSKSRSDRVTLVSGPIYSPKQLTALFAERKRDGTEFLLHSSAPLQYRVKDPKKIRDAVIFDMEQELRDDDSVISEREGTHFGTALAEMDRFADTHTTAESFLHSAIHEQHRKTSYFTAGLTPKGDKEVSKAIAAALPCELMSRGPNDLLRGCTNGNRFSDKMFYFGKGGSGLHCDRWQSNAVNINISDITLFLKKYYKN